MFDASDNQFDDAGSAVCEVCELWVVVEVVVAAFSRYTVGASTTELAHQCRTQLSVAEGNLSTIVMTAQGESVGLQSDGVPFLAAIFLKVQSYTRVRYEYELSTYQSYVPMLFHTSAELLTQRVI